MEWKREENIQPMRLTGGGMEGCTISVSLVNYAFVVYKWSFNAKKQQ